MEVLRRDGGAEGWRSGGHEERRSGGGEQEKEPDRSVHGWVCPGCLKVSNVCFADDVIHRYRNQFLIIEARKSDKSSRMQRQNRGLEIWDDG